MCLSTGCILPHGVQAVMRRRIDRVCHSSGTADGHILLAHNEDWNSVDQGGLYLIQAELDRVDISWTVWPKMRWPSCGPLPTGAPDPSWRSDGQGPLR